MERLSSARQLTIVQRKEWGEILTGFETRNRYAVLDDTGNPIYAAGERAGNLLARLFLKALRPFTIELLTPEGKQVLRVRRPFRFYFHEAAIEDASGRALGSIQRKWTLLRRRYEIRDAQGTPRFALSGPLLRPWTFWVRPLAPAAPGASGESAYRGQRGDGRIAKKWSGVLKEAFTDADHFGLEFPDGADTNAKALLLGAVFLIDFVHFENKGK